MVVEGRQYSKTAPTRYRKRPAVPVEAPPAARRPDQDEGWHVTTHAAVTALKRRRHALRRAYVAGRLGAVAYRTEAMAITETISKIFEEL